MILGNGSAERTPSQYSRPAGSSRAGQKVKKWSVCALLFLQF